jgi:hypothetical protein
VRGDVRKNSWLRNFELPSDNADRSLFDFAVTRHARNLAVDRVEAGISSTKQVYPPSLAGSKIAVSFMMIAGYHAQRASGKIEQERGEVELQKSAAGSEGRACRVQKYQFTYVPEWRIPRLFSTVSELALCRENPSEFVTCR